MSVTREELEGLARMARLELDPDEAEGLAHDLARILEHVRALKDVEASPEPSDPPSSSEDEAPPLPFSDAPPVADPLRRPPGDLAPEWRDGFFVVPRLAPLDRGDGNEQDP